MTRKHKHQGRLFWNKTKIIAIIVVLSVLTGLFIFMTIKTYVSPVQRKLVLGWHIDINSSHMQRDSIYDFLGINFNFLNDGTVWLPRIDQPHDIDFQGKTLNDDGFFANEEIMARWRKHNKEIQQRATGTWKIISQTPDSIFINAPKHPLHGKYAVYFFIDRNRSMDHIYKMVLRNDSTLLICHRGTIGFFPTDGQPTILRLSNFRSGN